MICFGLYLFKRDEGGNWDVFDAFEVEVPPLSERLSDEFRYVSGFEDVEDFFGVVVLFFGWEVSGAAVFVNFFAEFAHGLTALLHVGEEGGWDDTHILSAKLKLL